MGLGAQWAAIAETGGEAPSLSGWDALGLSGGTPRRRIDAGNGGSVAGLPLSLLPMQPQASALDAGIVAQKLVQIHQLAQIVRSMASMQSPLFGLQPSQTALAPLAPCASLALHQQTPHLHPMWSLLSAQPPAAFLGDQQALAHASSPTWPSNGGLPALFEVVSDRPHLPAVEYGLESKRDCVLSGAPPAAADAMHNLCAGEKLGTPARPAWARAGAPSAKTQKGRVAVRPTYLEHQPSRLALPATRPLGGSNRLRRPWLLGVHGAAAVTHKQRTRISASRKCHARARHVSGSSG